MRQELRRALTRRQKSRIIDTSRILSAVLVPVYEKQGEYYLLLTKRTEIVKDHKGQISFPGGAYEERDGTLLNTALRECTEEIGLEAETIEILGELDDFVTQTSNYVISPYVAAIPWPHQLKPDPTEVEEILEVPLSALLDRDCWRHETEVIDGLATTAYFYHYQDKIIWGATAEILNQFLDIWSEVMVGGGD